MHDTSPLRDQDPSGLSGVWDKRPSLPNAAASEPGNRSAAIFAQRVALPDRNSEASASSLGAGDPRQKHRRNSALFSLPLPESTPPSTDVQPSTDDRHDFVMVENHVEDVVAQARITRSRPSFRQRFWSKKGANVFDDDHTPASDGSTPRAAWVPTHAAQDFARSVNHGRAAAIEPKPWYRRHSYDSRSSRSSKVDAIAEEDAEKAKAYATTEAASTKASVCLPLSIEAPPHLAGGFDPELPGPADFTLFVTQAQASDRPKRAAAWAALMELQKYQMKQDEEERQRTCASADAQQPKSAGLTIDSAYCSGTSRDSVGGDASPSASHRRDSLTSAHPVKEAGGQETRGAENKWGLKRSHTTAAC